MSKKPSGRHQRAHRVDGLPQDARRNPKLRAWLDKALSGTATLEEIRKGLKQRFGINRSCNSISVYHARHFQRPQPARRLRVPKGRAVVLIISQDKRGALRVEICQADD